MPETVQHLIGQLADGRFPLRKLLGVTQNSAVFLTSSEPNGDAAIKLIPEDADLSAMQLARWQEAAKFSHPGLLRILRSGRCVIDGSPCLYIVTELADEDLGQLLPQRALTPDETRGMLAPVLETLDFLHENRLVHGGLKPSNVHAIGDQVKLSSDRILSAGESSSAWTLAAPFAAPESLLFPAADLWSLGVSLCQTLAQTLPERDGSGKWIAPDLPEPFDEIARSALVEDAKLRISLDSVRALLDPAFVPQRRIQVSSVPQVHASNVAVIEPNSPETLTEAVVPVTTVVSQAAAASGTSSGVSARGPLPQIDPLSVPLSPVGPPSKTPTRSSAAPSLRAPIPVSSLPQVNASVGGPRRVAIQKLAAQRSNKLAFVAGAAAIVLAILFVPKLLLRSAKAPASASTPIVSNTASSTSPPASEKSAASAKSAKTTNETSGAPAKAKEGSAITTASSSAPAPAKPAPAATSMKQAVSVTSFTAPTIVRKVLPEVSEKARSTISGTVRINIKVQLNSDGTVSAAEVNTPASSQFFADLALKAARQWQFALPASADSPAEPPASAQIRFEFTQTSTAAYVL